MTDEYAYKIEVSGTDIKEYYVLEKAVHPDKVAELWLNHVKEDNPIGPQLAKAYSESVKVTRLWETHQEPQAEQTRKVPRQEVEEVLEEGDEKQ